MMNKSSANLQDGFLNQVRKDGVGVTIYLMNGVQLKGLVRAFDSFTVLLDSPNKPSQLVYKHAMASIVPSQYISLFNGEKPQEEVSETENQNNNKNDAEE